MPQLLTNLVFNLSDSKKLPGGPGKCMTRWQRMSKEEAEEADHGQHSKFHGLGCLW